MAVHGCQDAISGVAGSHDWTKGRAGDFKRLAEERIAQYGGGGPERIGGQGEEGGDAIGTQRTGGDAFRSVASGLALLALDRARAAAAA